MGKKGDGPRSPWEAIQVCVAEARPVPRTFCDRFALLSLSEGPGGAGQARVFGPRLGELFFFLATGNRTFSRVVERNGGDGAQPHSFAVDILGKE